MLSLCVRARIGWTMVTFVLFCFGSDPHVLRSRVSNDNNFFLFSLCIYSLPNVNKMQIKYLYTFIHSGHVPFFVSPRAALLITLARSYSLPRYSNVSFLFYSFFLYPHLCFSSIYTMEMCVSTCVRANERTPCTQSSVCAIFISKKLFLFFCDILFIGLFVQCTMSLGFVTE